jgi:hypothetical protein
MQFGGYDEFSCRNRRPPPRTRAGVLAAAEHAVSLKATTKLAAITQVTKGVTGKSALFDLPSFDIIEHTMLDMMHLVFGVIGGHLMAMIVGAKLGNNLKNEQKRVLAAAAKADKLAEAAIEKARAAYEIERAAWAKRTRNARKAPKGSEARARMNEPPPPMPVYAPAPAAAAAAAARVSFVTIRN